jgi:VWFA-related protein
MVFPLFGSWVFVAASILAAAAAPSTPPASTPAASSPTVTFRKQVEEVQVVFTVRDGRRPVRDLSRDQMRLLDNGLEPSAVTSFQQDSNLPLQVALVIDHSDSMQKGFHAEVQAARQFLQDFMRPGVDSVSIVNFSVTVNVSRMDLGTAGETEHMSGLEPAGQTALYDALLAAAANLNIQSHASGPTRRVIVLLSDGEDNYSRAALADVIEAVERTDATIYAITAHDSHHEYRGDSVLRRIAAATGGRAFILKSYTEAGRVLAELQQELRNQYLVTFRPAANRSCGYHTIQILPRKPKLQVSARQGYWACSD